MSIDEKKREIARWFQNGYLPPKKGTYTMQDYLEARQTTEEVLKNDAYESLKELQDFTGANSVELNRKINKNSVETSLNMKRENGTLNSIKKEFNNGSVIEEKSYFKKPESIKERREIGKELKKDDYNQQERADRIGCSQPTISRDDRANKNNKKRIN